MKYAIFIVALCVIACNNQPKRVKPTLDSVSIVTNDTIPEARKTVSTKPVASYRVSVNDPKLERKFSVAIYETPFTFKFLLNMQYEAMLATDTLKIPNFGSWPVVQIKPGKDKRSVIIGFLDKKKQFKKYKMVSAYGDDLKLTVLKKYDVGVYRRQ